MAFVDELKVHIKAGNGGNGVVRWLHEKGKEFSGPAGGDGGKGGDILVKAVRDLSILARYRNTKQFEALKGDDGSRNSRDGKDGEDLIIEFPVGSVITNQKTGKKITLLEDGQVLKILKGGRGGVGNEEFRSSTNIRPMQSTDGKEGEEADFLIELELLVDAGFVGFPNAGKSSLLNALTRATAKVGDYKFTTLEPNLGELYGFILADIPGLIEGASEGKGLGHAFLRHIKRTKMIIHCVSLENEDVLEAYNTIRAELTSYGETLPEKKEVILLTKTDLVTPASLKKSLTKMKKVNKNVLTVSILDDESVKKLKDGLVKVLREV
ncbi:MAG: GTPase ObgE [Candidatus Taylorbacteria bacterium]|nr:GTPase ObgE [Candidatus Taylorbacteria bacterium]